MYLIKDTSKLTGVSIRTLHHYDNIGLVKPFKAANGYRYYQLEDIEKIQIIRYYKYLGFSLTKIKQILEQNDTDTLAILRSQIHLLEKEKETIETLIQSIKQTISAKTFNQDDKNTEQFEGFSVIDHISYQGEAITKFGKDIMIASKEKQVGNETNIARLFNRIFREFANQHQQHEPTSHTKTILLCEKLYLTINQNGFNCSLKIFQKIGSSYVQNLEFKNNIDLFGDGTAAYISEAIDNFVNIQHSNSNQSV
ncbi:MerR family transcriptional regulator [Pseudolactococcus plantarum]|uniref:TipAS antibiotic-recognition domain protein n=1 Tax=Pseudolactococcus plantarum TaxID=1365 RepID=A0A2A5S439_9LACT|nr:MerR family transcriptional regulator [Lactococcus plantarum]PCS08212.1 TipAS antibiotic-recognition domain protein [Lactococcus plantarum]